jgi:large subunit ribosomal protein L10
MAGGWQPEERIEAGFMALTKQAKAEKVEHLARELEGSTSAIVGTFQKLTVAQDFELRKVVRGAGGRYRVLKNKLAARAAKGTKVEQALQNLKGVSSIAYTGADPVALAKALSTWVQENAEFTFKLGIIDGKLISVEEVKQLATMPGKEELYSKLLFLINAPAQRLVTVLNAAGRDLAVVLNQGVEKQKFAAAPQAEGRPAVEAPAAALPVTEAPAPQASAAEAPTVETPAAKVPAVEAAAAEAPTAEAPAVEAPAAEAPAAEAPAVEAPAAEAPGAS